MVQCPAIRTHEPKRTNSIDTIIIDKLFHQIIHCALNIEVILSTYHVVLLVNIDSALFLVYVHILIVIITYKTINYVTELQITEA